MSTAPEVVKEDQAASNAQNQPTMPTSSIPEIKETSTPDNSTATENAQNQPNLAGKPEVGDGESTTTTSSSNPPQDENLTPGENTQNQATTSSHGDDPGKKVENKDTSSSAAPEIAGQVKPLPTDTLAQSTTQKTENQQNSDQVDAPKLDLDNVVTKPSTETLNQDSAIMSDPPTETSKQDSANVTTDPSPATSKQDSSHITTDPSTETPKQESSTVTQTDKKTDPSASKKDSICLPLPVLIHRLKDKKQEPKKPALVQESAVAPSKDDLPKAPTSAQSSPNIPSKDNTPERPTTPKQNTDLSSKDELSKSIDADIHFIKEESSKLGQYKDHVSSLVNDAAERFEELKNVGTVKELRELKKEVTKLKLQIPSKHKGSEEKGPHKSQQDTGILKKRQKNIPELVMKQMPQLYKSSQFESSSEVRDFERLFDELSLELKLCLVCFSIFPENAIIKKRLMVYWWISEGFVPPLPRNDEIRQQIANGKTDEEFAEEFFEQLTRMGFIEPVNKKHCLSVACYKVHPFVRLALIMMAEKEKFFNFDEEGMPTEKSFEKSFETFQACLIGRGLIDYQDLQKGVVNSQGLEKLHAVFNVNEPILDVRPDWFVRMKDLNVLYLGRWKVSATDHIEVEETSFLDGLSAMDHLRFFSLQGVSRIMELPDSISQLSSLIILDMRACHSLESIPEGIRFLRNLTYLDFSECYLLEHMPKGLSFLSNLKVLKGFVVGEKQDKHTCSLDDLAKLERLIKLTIYTGLREFPGEKDLIALQNFKMLKKLTIAWGGNALHNKAMPTPQPSKPANEGQGKKPLTKTGTLGKTLKKFSTFKGSAATATIQLKLENLEKLDLKSFPKSATPTWLRPSCLKSLKKLYIRGGNFSDIGQYEDLDFQEGTQGPGVETWNVEILRLKYLSELDVDWRKLQELFPNLIYLEKVNCPKLSFFPSDGYGVWINKEKLKKMQVRS